MTNIQWMRGISKGKVGSKTYNPVFNSPGEVRFCHYEGNIEELSSGGRIVFTIDYESHTKVYYTLYSITDEVVKRGLAWDGAEGYYGIPDPIFDQGDLIEFGNDPQFIDDSLYDLLALLFSIRRQSLGVTLVDAGKLDQDLTSIADAIRERTELKDELDFPNDYCNAVLHTISSPCSVYFDVEDDEIDREEELSGVAYWKDDDGNLRILGHISGVLLQDGMGHLSVRYDNGTTSSMLGDNARGVLFVIPDHSIMTTSLASQPLSDYNYHIVKAGTYTFDNAFVAPPNNDEILLGSLGSSLSSFIKVNNISFEYTADLALMKLVKYYHPAGIELGYLIAQIDEGWWLDYDGDGVDDVFQQIATHNVLVGNVDYGGAYSENSYSITVTNDIIVPMTLKYLFEETATYSSL